MPILGITASQITGRLTTPDSGAMIPLGMVQVGSGGAANITFSSIPSTYKHLQIRGITRGTRANINTNVYFGFNSDTTTGNYYGHGLYGDGSSAGALAKIGTATNALIASIAASGAANAFSGFVVDVLDYANTNKYKTSRSLNGYEDNSAGQMWLQSGLWMSTSAITSIQITDPLGNFAQYSQFALYGIL